MAPGFYARLDTKTPVKIAIVVLVFTQLMNLVLVPYMGFAGLAWSIGLGATLNAAWLFVGLRRAGLYKPEAGWLRYAAKVICATTVLGAVLWFSASEVDWLGLRSQPFVRIGILMGTFALAAAVYAAMLGLLGLRVRDFRRQAH